MKSIIQFSLHHSRTVLSVLFLLLVSGWSAYQSIPKESFPDVEIPMLYISTTQDGISPEDSEKLLLQPLEQELRSVEGIKEMKSTAYEGGCNVILEFNAGFDSKKAKNDVRDKVDRAKQKLPRDANDPTINEINLSLFPVLNVKISGHVQERILYKVAQDLKDRIEENVPTILEATLVGDRKEMVEINIDPLRLETYNISIENTIQMFISNNVMVSAGRLNTGRGEFSIKVPGLVETVDDIFNIPVMAKGDKVVKFKDISDIKRTYQDATSFARDKGKQVVCLQIIKRTGENLLNTVAAVRAVVDHVKPYWPQGIEVSYSQDQSKKVITFLNDLQNNLILAVILVMVVMIASMGTRAALLVGVAVPGSFLTGILVLSLMGYTINTIVLFSLILASGMLVDGAIIVVEYADRRMTEGLNRFDAYYEGAIRMLWPVVSSISTILAVFLPLLFWPGVVGQFMKFLPITLLATLTASIFMAIVFVPVLGSLFGKVSYGPETKTYQTIIAAEHGDYEKTSGLTRYYLKALTIALDHPGRIISGAFGILVSIITVYVIFGAGVEFFPTTDPEQASIGVRARGNLSIEEKDVFVKEVEKILIEYPELQSVDSQVVSGAVRSMNAMGGSSAPDQVGSVLVEFIDWTKRKPATVILEDIRQKLQKIPGVYADITNQKMGPPSGKPVKINITSMNASALLNTLKKLRSKLESMEGIINIDDNRNLPGIQWNIHINRAQAAKFGTNIQLIGGALKLVTNGQKLGTYRPSDSQDELDVILRFPKQYRNLDQLNNIKIPTRQGAVPVSNFVKIEPSSKVGVINRLNANRVLTLTAEVDHGVNVTKKINELKNWISHSTDLDPSANIAFAGEDKDQKESGEFLGRAFMVAIFMIAVILVTQFNSFFSAILILSAVIMSTIGVFIGLLIHGRPFGVVMTGIGVIALAGIIVSNNIVLIDTFDAIKDKFESTREALLRTCAQRLRPVILTKLTTILGLLPIMMGLNIDFIERDINIGGPITEFWKPLALCIVYGVLFASMLTLFVTPSALMLRANYRDYKGKKTNLEFFKEITLNVYKRVLKVKKLPKSKNRK